jgi:hypothetical protein
MVIFTACPGRKHRVQSRFKSTSLLVAESKMAKSPCSIRCAPAEVEPLKRSARAKTKACKGHLAVASKISIDLTILLWM